MSNALSPEPSRPRSGKIMFFPLSKIAFFLITPSNFFIVIGLVGCLLLFTQAGAAIGRVLAILGFLGLLAGGLSPLATWTILPLEQRFPAFVDDGRPITGVIVLGGGLMTAISAERDQLTLNDAGERQLALGDLARRYPQARLVFSGGSASLTEGAVTEAGTVGRFAGSLGVPRDRLILEERSRNTRENARFTAELVQPKPEERWLLVTSAWHMPRAVGCFRKAGFPVTAYPVDYRTAGSRDVGRFNTFASDGLLELDLAVKEWIGLVVYRLVGYTDEWMPAP
ncbi:membrane protein [Methylobacterium gnaphalii]|uniref:Membrane protein n=2 Tax=Methylobacterium gnaphalii TaxID=1010610 RepID=A0A512JHK8_9HYPH|nr:membrane protein [Methylobacterium gnaphalii]GLS49171.1 membrane protein [Methylobacterium gnaphalii]